MQQAGAWIDLMRTHIPPEEKVFTWWSYRARGLEMPPTAAGGSITSGHPPILRRRLSRVDVLREARGWERPSDHVPVTAHFEF
jgi:exodeoxyribonuclease-3